jgi:hypothetical protein
MPAATAAFLARISRGRRGLAFSGGTSGWLDIEPVKEAAALSFTSVEVNADRPCRAKIWYSAKHPGCAADAVTGREIAALLD